MTFVLYGLLPMGIVGYILGTPSRKRAIKAREMAERAAYEEAQAQAAAAPASTGARCRRPDARCRRAKPCRADGKRTGLTG